MRLVPVLLLRLALLVAMSASAALVVDYANAGDPAFCGVTSGCFAVRRSEYAYLFGLVQLPYVGLAAYSALFALAFLAKNRLQHTVVAVLAGLGGLFAAYLLWLQHAVIGAMCPWCVAVDTSAIIAAVSATWVALKARKDESSVQLPARSRVSWAWIVAAIVGAGAPFIWGTFPVDAPPPEAIRREHVPDKLTIVSFTDFECPFCRRLHPELHQIVDEHKGRVRLVRKMMPLPGHPGAEPAALVYLCTPENLREAVADKLYHAEPPKLTPDGAMALGISAGVDGQTLSKCLNSPATRVTLEADKKLFEQLGGPGLPFTFVGKRVVIGANVNGLKTAVASELSGSHPELPLWAMFVLIGAGFVGAIGLTMAAESERSRQAA